jgi:hypothetical protein
MPDQKARTTRILLVEDEADVRLPHVVDDFWFTIVRLPRV